MGAPRAPGQAAEWMGNGFPPRSFPNELESGRTEPRPERVVVGATSVTRTGGSGGRGLGRWIAAAAVLLALLLLVGGLVLAKRGGDGANVASRGTTTTAAADTAAPSFESPTSVLVPTSIDPVGRSTAVDNGSSSTTTAAAATPAPAPGAGVLETSVSDLAVPKVDATSGPQANRLTLRNTGGTDISYATQSSSAALTASPGQATIPAGGSTELTVTLNGSKITSEGPFAGSVTFDGNGGSKAVRVTSVVGRPPSIYDKIGNSCSVPSPSCSRQIRVAATSNPNATPCDTPWIYAVVIVDQSLIQSAKATARRNLANADAALVTGGQPRGASGAYVSNAFPPLGAGTVLRFTLEAVDQFGFTVRLAQQAIYC